MLEIYYQSSGTYTGTCNLGRVQSISSHGFLQVWSADSLMVLAMTSLRDAPSLLSQTISSGRGSPSPHHAFPLQEGLYTILMVGSHDLQRQYQSL